VNVTLAAFLKSSCYQINQRRERTWLFSYSTLLYKAYLIVFACAGITTLWYLLLQLTEICLI